MGVSAAGKPAWGGKPATWDLTALLNAADPKAPRPERHLWLVRLIEWLRHGHAEWMPMPARHRARCCG